MILSQATPKDAASIAAVHVHTRQVAYADTLPATHLLATIESFTQQCRTRMEETHKPTFVAELDGRVIGFIRFGRGEFAPSADAGAPGAYLPLTRVLGSRIW